MISRRHFVQAGMAAAAITGAPGAWSRLAAQQVPTQDQLLQFETFGTVSLIHVTDVPDAAGRGNPVGLPYQGRCRVVDSWSDRDCHRGFADRLRQRDRRRLGYSTTA